MLHYLLKTRLFKPEFCLYKTLLSLLLGITLLLWLLMAISSYITVRQQTKYLFDAHLAQFTQTLYYLVQHELYEELSKSDVKKIRTKAKQELIMHLISYKHEKKVAFQIQINGQVLLKSAEAPTKALTDKLDGFSDVRFHQKEWRVYSLTDKKLNAHTQIIIQVAELKRTRTTISDTIAFKILLPLMLGLPLMAGLIRLTLSTTLTPLTQIVQQVANRQSHSLEPIVAKQAPCEILPLILELNDLFCRLAKSFEREHQFTANASHELRTPLAGIKIQAQVALNSRKPEIQQQALLKIIQGIDRSSYLVEQLLTLARLDPDNQNQTGFRQISIQPLIQQLLNQLSQAIETKQIHITTTIAKEVPLWADATQIEILLRNLLDNAIRYLPPKGRINIQCLNNRHSHVSTLIVEDNGIGLTPEQQQHIFERFYRADDNNHSGTGLGLSIVQRIVERHQATIDLSSAPKQGVKITINFPNSPDSN